MRCFTQIDTIAAPLPLDNVDTDKILPGEYLKTVSRTGLGRALFARMRYRDDGSEVPDFILNRGPWRNAGILIAGANFGCGSSREHAPWALIDFGISCVIAESFADIFYNNCFKNGILPIVLEKVAKDRLLRLAADPKTARFQVDLKAQTIATQDGRTICFEIDPGRKAALIEGRDEISETLAQDAALTVWEARNADHFPSARIALATLSSAVPEIGDISE